MKKFIATAVLSGWILVDSSEDVLFALILGGLVATAASVFLLPDQKAPKAEGVAPVGAVLANRRFRLFLVSAALIQGSHGVFYAFSTIHWRSVGYSEDLIGLLWAEGVVAEILLFAVGTALIKRIGPVRLLALAGAAAALRWTVTGVTDALPALIAVQALHAFSFGAAHLGAIHFITGTVAPSLSATAQSVYSAAVMGLGMGLSIFAAGYLYEGFGAGAFLAMAVLGGAGSMFALRLLRTETD